jgi:predicted nuclease of predicted toxin-antitoxin system
VKFLIDRCAGHRLAEWLRAQDHDVVESRERGPDPGDRVLLEWAGAEDRILVTMERILGFSSFSIRSRTAALSACPMYLRTGVSS